MQGLSIRAAGRPAVFLLALLPSFSWACATCGCTLSTDAAMGYSALPGWRVNFEYDYIDQSQLRSGTHAVSGVRDGNELEHDTTSHYLNLGIAYSPDADWNITLRVPYVIRDHSTYGTFDSTRPLPDLSTSHSSSLGDVKLVGGYQGFLPTHNLGIQLGVKLPTGAYGTDVNFNSGPNAGTALDASLQPGSGRIGGPAGQRRYRGLFQPGPDRERDARFATVRFCPGPGLQRAQRLPAVPALDRIGGFELRVLNGGSHGNAQFETSLGRQRRIKGNELRARLEGCLAPARVVRPGPRGDRGQARTCSTRETARRHRVQSCRQRRQGRGREHVGNVVRTLSAGDAGARRVLPSASRRRARPDRAQHGRSRGRLQGERADQELFVSGRAGAQRRHGWLRPHLAPSDDIRGRPQRDPSHEPMD